MSIETVMVARLVGYSGLSALVGSRIYPNVMPQNVDFPAISYRRVSTTRESAMGSDTGIARARFQVDSYAKNYDEVRPVAEKVRAALQRWRNSSGTVVQDSFIIGETDSYEHETQVHRVSQDFEVIYVEA